MTPRDIATRRLAVQRIEDSSLPTVAQVVAWLGAMQAQDYRGALWAVGLRSNTITEQDVTRALAKGEIVRTWPMRGTLHFVAADDIRWMLDLLAQRVIRGSASRWKRLELNDEIFNQCTAVLAKAMQGGKQLIRAQIYQLLEAKGISTANQRGNHIIWRLALHQTLCFGAHQEKNPTYTLLDEWVPKSKQLTADEALVEITLRYFKSHGPATIQDLMWWSGLNGGEVKQALAELGNRLASETFNDKTYWFDPNQKMPKATTNTYLLPAFDEFLLGYRDRSAVLNLEHAQKVVPGNNGMFMPIMVSNGQVKAIWKRSQLTNRSKLSLIPFEKITPTEVRHVVEPLKHYAAFLGHPVELAQD